MMFHSWVSGLIGVGCGRQEVLLGSMVAGVNCVGLCCAGILGMLATQVRG